MNALEKAARAAFDVFVDEGSPKVDPNHVWVTGGRDAFLPLARAVLMAVRDADAPKLRARVRDIRPSWLRTKEEFTAMIDAILSEDAK